MKVGAISSVDLDRATHAGEALILVTGGHETGGLTIAFTGIDHDTCFSLPDSQKIARAGRCFRKRPAPALFKWNMMALWNGTAVPAPMRPLFLTNGSAAREDRPL